MIAAAARRWPLAVAALAAVAGIVAAGVVATTDNSQPTPEFTLNSTVTAFPVGEGHGSCETFWLSPEDRDTGVVVIDVTRTYLGTSCVVLDVTEDLFAGLYTPPSRAEHTPTNAQWGQSRRSLLNLPAPLSHGSWRVLSLNPSSLKSSPLEVTLPSSPKVITIPAESFRLYFQ